MEKEQDDRLSSQDVLITHLEQGFMSFMYQKSSFIGYYFNFNSHHPYNVKKLYVANNIEEKPLVVTLIYIKINEQLKRQPPLQQLPREHNIDSKRNLDRTTENNTWKLNIICLPYVKGLAEKS